MVNDPFDRDDAWPGPQLLATWTVPTLPTEFADRVLFDWHSPRSVAPLPSRERRRVPGFVAATTIALAVAIAALVVLWLAPRGTEVPTPAGSPVGEAAVAHPVHATTSVVLQVSPRDAVVHIDGVRIAGPTPFVATTLSPGMHTIDVRRDGFMPLTKVVEVDHDGLHLSFVLDVADVVLEVATDPPGAEVRILTGTRELASGRGADRFAIRRADGDEIAVEVSAPGFHTRRVPVRFSGAPQDRMDVALAPDLGAFFPPPAPDASTSDLVPPKFGAPATGRTQGRKPSPPAPSTPVPSELQDPFAGTPPPSPRGRAGDLKDPFHRPAAPPANPFAVLRIGVLPGNGPAEVFVDGRRVGTTPIATLRVAPGSHQLRWEWASGHAFEQTITVAADETKLVKGGV